MATMKATWESRNVGTQRYSPVEMSAIASAVNSAREAATFVPGKSDPGIAVPALPIA